MTEKDLIELDFPHMVLLLTCILTALFIFAPNNEDDDTADN